MCDVAHMLLLSYNLFDQLFLPKLNSLTIDTHKSSNCGHQNHLTCISRDVNGKRRRRGLLPCSLSLPPNQPPISITNPHRGGFFSPALVPMGPHRAPKFIKKNLILNSNTSKFKNRLLLFC